MSSITTRNSMNNMIDMMDLYPESLNIQNGWKQLTRSNNPKLIIMVGGPASGKSIVRTSCADYCKIQDALILNPDTFMEKKFNNDNSKRSQVNKDFRELYTNIFENKLGINIIYDRTGAYKEHTEFIINMVKSSARKRGDIQYEVILCIVVTPVDIGLTRALTREQEIGRSVPPNIIMKIYETIDDIIETYETNQYTKLFPSMQHAKNELSGAPSRPITIETNGSISIPTHKKGNVSIEPGKFTVTLASNRKKLPKSLSTPINSTQITKTEEYGPDLNINSQIHINTQKGDRISFINSHKLFDKIIAFDNTKEGSSPELIYYYKDGKVVIDMEMTQLIKARENNKKNLYNHYDILNTRTARAMAAQGGKTKKSKRISKI